MLIITVRVDAPAGQAVGVKEQIAQTLESLGDVRVTSIKEVYPEYRQMEIGGLYDKESGTDQR